MISYAIVWDQDHLLTLHNFTCCIFISISFSFLPSWLWPKLFCLFILMFSEVSVRQWGVTFWRTLLFDLLITTILTLYFFVAIQLFQYFSFLLLISQYIHQLTLACPPESTDKVIYQNVSWGGGTCLKYNLLPQVVSPESLSAMAVLMDQ